MSMVRIAAKHLHIFVPPFWDNYQGHLALNLAEYVVYYLFKYIGGRGPQDISLYTKSTQLQTTYIIHTQ